MFFPIIQSLLRLHTNLIYPHSYLGSSNRGSSFCRSRLADAPLHLGANVYILEHNQFLHMSYSVAVELLPAERYGFSWLFERGTYRTSDENYYGNQF